MVLQKIFIDHLVTLPLREDLLRLTLYPQRQLSENFSSLAGVYPELFKKKLPKGGCKEPSLVPDVPLTYSTKISGLYFVDGVVKW